MFLTRSGSAFMSLALCCGLVLARGQTRAADPTVPDGPSADFVPSFPDDLLTQAAAPPATGPSANPPTPAPNPAPTSPGPGFGREPSPRVLAPLVMNPRMIGDFPGLFALAHISTPGTTLFFSGPFLISSPFSGGSFTRIPVAAGGVLKIAENQSPVPEDRVFTTFNFYSNLESPGVRLNTGTAPFPGKTFTVTPPIGPPIVVVIPPIPSMPLTLQGAAGPKPDVYREIFGVEKTFLDGQASIQLEVPVQETDPDPADGSQGDGFGDLSVILKYALLEDQSTGDVFSAGLEVTAPTGLAIHAVAPGPFISSPDQEFVIHPWAFQPFVGYVYNMGNLYVEGFTSLYVPTDIRDVTLLFNDVSLGYHLYKQDEGFLRSITPTFETHVNTPLNHLNPTDLISAPNSVDLTAGVHFGLGERATLTVGVDTPVTGPRPYDFEVISEFNLRY